MTSDVLDADLIARMTVGDREAFALLFRRHQATVYRFSRQMMGSKEAAEDVTHGKPDPEVFLIAAQRLGAEPRRSIVVEDAPTGIEAGRRAGMRTVGVGLLHALPAADVYVSTLSELPADTFERLLR